MFRHPRRGCQLVKGTIEPGESPAQAALRELFEETGIADARVVEDLGLWRPDEGPQLWSFQRCQPAQALPDTWSHHCTDTEDHRFELFWHLLAQEPRDTFPVFVRAIASVRARLREVGR